MRNKFSYSRSMKHLGIAVVAIVLAVLASCEKEVKIDMKNGDASLVVEGSIENNLPPYVFLTKSIGYFAKIDLNTLQNSFVHGAEVTVSDGSQTVKLKEYTIDTGMNGNKFSFYSIDTSVLPFFVGQLEKTYTLKIVYEGKTYEATTKIPNPTPLDSVLSVVPPAPFDASANPTARQIKVYFKDPDTLGNYVKYYTSRNGGPYYAGLNSVYTDEIINGTKFNTVFPLGEPRSSARNFDSLGLAYVGDTVTFKWSAIDKRTYDFWSTYEYSLGTLGNPFSTPINVRSNISNGGLGVWAGYGSIYTQLIMK